MSKKHNTKHLSRGISNYPARLAARGESSATVRMPFIGRNGRSYDTMEAAIKRDKEMELEVEL